MIQYQERKTNWVLHLILTILFWPWLVVWIWCALRNEAHNKELREKVQAQALVNLHNRFVPDIDTKVKK